MPDQSEIDTKKSVPVADQTPVCLQDIVSAGVLAIIMLLLYLLPAFLGRPLTETAETRIAVVAREMIESKNYIVPTLGGVPRLYKPVLQYWPAAATTRLLAGDMPPDQQILSRGVEIPSALFSALTVFIVALYGSFIFGRAAGLIAGILLGLSPLLVSFAQMGYADTTLMFGCAGATCAAAWLVCSSNPGALAACAFGAGLGIAVLVKDPIPFLLLGGALVSECLLRRRWSTRKVLLFTLGFVVAAVVVAPWFIAISMQIPDALSTMLKERQHYFHAGHAQDDRWAYYLYKLAGGMLPWTPILIGAVVLYFTAMRKRNRETSDQPRVASEHLRFFTLVSGLGFAALYLQAKQQDHYLLPVMPALALVSGYILSRFKNPGLIPEENMAWLQLILGMGVVALIGSAPLWSHQLGQPKISAILESFPWDGWSVSTILGIVLAGLFFFCARQWVEGRALVSIIALGVGTYIGLAGWSIYRTNQARNSALFMESNHLRSQLQGLGNEIKVYAAGRSQPILMFYLERPVKTLEDLSREPNINTEILAPQRVLIASRTDLRKLNLNALIPDGLERYVAVSSRDFDWPKELGPILRKKQMEEVPFSSDEP